MEKFMRNVLNVVAWHLFIMFFVSLAVLNAAGREIPVELVLGVPIFMAGIFINAELMVCISEDEKKSLIKDVNKALAQVSTLRVTYEQYPRV